MSLAALKKKGCRKAFQSPVLATLQQHSELDVESDTAVDELLRCSFNEFCIGLKIKSPEGLQPFELFEWQDSFANLVIDSTRSVIALLSSRQTGKTSTCLALMLYMCLSRRQFTGLAIHRTLDDARLLARRIKKLIPDWVELSNDSLSLIAVASTQSQIIFRSSNPNRDSEGAEGAGRGLESVDLAYVEEASHTRNLKALVGVIGPCLTWGNPGSLLMVGTGSNRESHFYQVLKDAAGGDEQQLENTLEQVRHGSIEPFQVLRCPGSPIGVITHYRAVPRFAANPRFIQDIQAELQLTDEQIACEYELKFESSENASLFDFTSVQAAIEGEWEPAGTDQVYYAAVDPAASGKDFTVCIVLQKLEGRYKVVKLYRQRVGTSEQHLAKIAKILQTYDPILTYCEKNALGQLYLENLSATCRNQTIEGFQTSRQSKELIIGKIVLALERQELKIPKSAIIDELLAFRRFANGKMGASGKANDDCVLALGIALDAAGFPSRE